MSEAAPVEEEVRGLLASLDEPPLRDDVAAHVGVYAEVHRRLQGALADLDQRPASGVTGSSTGSSTGSGPGPSRG